jgi:hypothetical protein
MRNPSCWVGRLHSTLAQPLPQQTDSCVSGRGEALGLRYIAPWKCSPVERAQFFSGAFLSDTLFTFKSTCYANIKIWPQESVQARAGMHQGQGCVNEGKTPLCLWSFPFSFLRGSWPADWPRRLCVPCGSPEKEGPWPPRLMLANQQFDPSWLSWAFLVMLTFELKEKCCLRALVLQPMKH